MVEVDQMKCRGSRLGQSMVELALFLPIITMLMLGAIDLGRVFHAKITIANASRTAAVYAVNHRVRNNYASDTAATTAVKQIAVNEAAPAVTLTTSNVAFTTTWQPGVKYTVTVTTTWSAITPLVNQLWGGGTLQLQHSTELRHSCVSASPCASY